MELFYNKKVANFPIESYHRATQMAFVNRFRRTFIFLALLMVGGGVFARLVRCKFLLWDDKFNIIDNDRVAHPTLENWVEYVKHPLRGGPVYDMYIPVTHTAWVVLSKLSKGDHPRSIVFHLANLLIHVLVSWGVWLFLRRCFLRISLSTRQSDVAAFLGALFFLLHPAQVEPVAWVSGTKDLLGGLFGVLALERYMRCLSCPPMTRKCRACLAATVVCYFLSLLSKPATAALPFLFILMAFLFNRLKKDWLFLTFLIVLTVPFVLLNNLIQQRGLHFSVPFLWKPFLAGNAINFYFLKLLTPFSLGLNYGLRPAMIMSSNWSYGLGLAPYLFLIGLTRFRGRGRKPVILAAGLFLGGLLPTLGFFNFQFQIYSTVSDRYLYLAMVGPALLWGVSFVFSTRPWIKGVMVGILVLFATKSFLQTRVWTDDITLFSHAMKVNPKCEMAYVNLGVAWVVHGDLKQAAVNFDKALEINPANVAAAVNRRKFIGPLEKG